MSARDTRRMLVLLEQERAALRRADLPRLEQILPRKLALLERLEAESPLQTQEMGAIRDAARVNARLFDALIAGMREARALISALHARARGQTYARDGARAMLDPPSGTLHRRA